MRAGLATLTIASRRGRKLTYGAAERAHIVALARRTLDREWDGAATRSSRALERAARGAGSPRVGVTTIRRVLHAAGSSHQRTRTWCPTGTAVRKRKDGRVRADDPDAERKKGSSSRRIG